MLQDLELMDNNHGMLWNWTTLDILLLDDTEQLLPYSLLVDTAVAAPRIDRRTAQRRKKAWHNKNRRAVRTTDLPGSADTPTPGAPRLRLGPHQTRASSRRASSRSLFLAAALALVRAGAVPSRPKSSGHPYGVSVVKTSSGKFQVGLRSRVETSNGRYRFTCPTNSRIDHRMLFRGRVTLDCGVTSFLPLRGFRGLSPHQPAPRSCTSQAPEDSAAQARPQDQVVGLIKCSNVLDYIPVRVALMLQSLRFHHYFLIRDQKHHRHHILYPRGCRHH